MIHHIFRRIGIDDLINCRLVCKKFKFVVEQKKVDELILTNEKHDWFYSKKTVNPYCVVPFGKVLFAGWIFKFEQNLKRLRIEFKGANFALYFINSLLRLEELDIWFHLNHGLFTFVLPNLLVLRVLEASGDDLYLPMTLAFKTPKLEAIQCADLACLQIEDPLTVRYYQGQIYDEEIEKFKNLEYLCLDNADYIDRNVLTTFSSLKELRLYWSCLGYDWNCEDDADAMNVVADILKQKLVLRRIDFRLYLQGVEIRDKNLFIDNTYLNDQDFQLQNYALFDQACTFCDDPAVDYCALLKLKSEIPGDFFTKFPHITKVKAKESIADGDQLIWFLKNVGDQLSSLHLKNTTLSQAFYDQLPQLTNLGTLKISEETEINYKFALKMKKLNSLVIKRESPDVFAFAMQMFKRSPALSYFRWKIAEDYVVVTRSHSDPKLFSLLWFNKQMGFQIKLNRERISSHELATNYYSLIAKSGVTTRKRHAVQSEQSKPKVSRSLGDIPNESDWFDTPEESESSESVETSEDTDGYESAYESNGFQSSDEFDVESNFSDSD